MSNANGVNAQKMDRYSGGCWTELQRAADEIQQAHERGGLSENQKHRLADRLREVLGGAKVAGRLISIAMQEHRRSVEWGLERLLVSARQLEDLPYVEAVEREMIEQRIGNIITMVDLGEMDAAEARVREVEARVEQLRRASLEAEFTSLLASIGEVYQTV